MREKINPCRFLPLMAPLCMNVSGPEEIKPPSMKRIYTSLRRTLTRTGQAGIGGGGRAPIASPIRSGFWSRHSERVSNFTRSFGRSLATTCAAGAPPVIKDIHRPLNELQSNNEDACDALTEPQLVKRTLKGKLQLQHLVLF